MVNATMNRLQSALSKLLPEYTIAVFYIYEPAHEDDPRPAPMYRIRAARRDPERNNESYIMMMSITPEFVEDAAIDIASFVAASFTETWDKRNTILT